VSAGQVREWLELLGERGLLAGGELTADGQATAARLVDARHASLMSLVADWRPDDDPRVNDAIARLARELGADAPAAAR
jgi:hypothetical protein